MIVTMSVSGKNGPLYLQIKKILKDRILHGVYPIETNIPSETLLESEFQVSKITVRNAIKELVQEGYLEKKSGKGTKVIRNTSFSKLSKGKRFTEVLVEEKHKILKQLLQTEIVTNQEGTEPYRWFGEHCLRIERLYYLDDVPYIHYTHYLSEGMKATNTSDLSLQSLYEWIGEQGINLGKFRDEFAVGIAPSHVEDILSINKGTPLLKRLRYSYDDTGNLIEYSEGYYNTEMQHYIVNYDV
ncbi:GntR family transcriptional regulator [Paenibacillus sp. IHBB 10380]|uniref:GntR family transcriptional regulator n=1 Tax=Paenibacillus sp. IHBB 10380 TaxID=1566358 RepID=UPI000AEF5686|nr:GntR family transcriptional regulator [Paenibacillus sp. IHBB 10380]